ncbi:hypothetical protein CH333_09820 [candidate division WOR-3 bacterium JGI_Cruoil_03_44_89]|uniref:histidine kinase n=1 Tax=candidate division WOR-3 bacterium JGI_Cruoil_03_44_89 TaxID=1973748 RepID=A0A235BQI9_UNCW3|nr:MAG: hypothetical protein CH333_09820 [candidate division WOR-3 bacterium JGI_Cruoil_03_44_89]
MYSTLKNYIILVVILVLVGFVMYSEYMMNQLENETETVSRIYGRFIGSAGSEDTELNIIFDEVIQKIKFPVVVVDTAGRTIASTNIERGKEREAISRLANIHQPVEVKYLDIPLCTVYYGNTKARSFLKWAPYLQIALAFLLLLIAVLWFRGAKKTEESMIWAGIAKETAHQLGTPLSSLMAWTEFIKDTEIKNEMMKDIGRLEEVSERFSRIGSISFKSIDINGILADSINYVKKRIPHLENKVTINEDYRTVPHPKIDDGLISWAVENILKNAVDADSTRIDVKSERRGKFIRLSIKDNGKGIKKRDLKRIFDAGFTTKEYGWGMGLSLTKRIIDLHGGRIFCVSREGNGSTFVIQLPIDR